MSADSAAAQFTKDNPFPSQITENRVLNNPGSAKETRHFVVSWTGSDLAYKAGDSLGVFATNRTSEVEELLELVGATGEEMVSPTMLRLEEAILLSDALGSRLSLAKPTAKIVKTLAEKATDPAEQAKLNGLLDPEAKEVLTTFLADHEYADLLAEFPSAKLTAQELVDHMRKLMPRLYSIASSPRMFPQEIHLTVAIVRYETNKRERVGVCSTFMSDRVTVGQTPVPVFVSNSHFGPPEDGDRYCIMIGPGTGIAPFRAFIQDRIASEAKGRNLIFFGDQKKATDYLYEEEWEDYKAKGQVDRLDLAWSRDQAEKIYVQDKMRDNAAELWSWLDGGANFYVCGDAKRMAKDVDAALHEIVAKHGKMDSADATTYVKQLKKDKRYQRDVY